MMDNSFDFPSSGGLSRPGDNEIHVEFRSGYSDQPLGFSRPAEREAVQGEAGRGMRQDEHSAGAEPVPAKIAEMKAIYFNFSYASRSSAWFFYQQGKFMEDYEDCVFYDRPFKRYYPTYNDLSVRQLRGYFGWRTRFREGRNDPSVPASFLYLYIYELLDNIGVGPEEGFAELRYMDETFGAKDETMHRHLSAWTRDYVVYYGLDAACAALYFDSVGSGARSALRAYEETGEVSPGLFEAVESLSSYHVGRSPCYKEDPEGMKQAVLKSIQCVSGHLQAQGRGTLSRHCLGAVRPRPVRLFSGAVFYDHLRYEDYTYEVSPARIYRCRRGIWTLEQDTAAERPSALIGWILRETDRQMRLQTGTGHELKPSPGSPEPLTVLIRQAVSDYLQEKREAARPKIEFDMSSLGRIRSDADAVMASLLIAEEPELEEPAHPEPEEVPAAAAVPAYEAVLPDGIPGLTPDETEFLRALLSGEPWKDLLRGKHLLPSMLADSINEKLMDVFGDVVIEFDGEDPVLVEDYEEELKKLFSGGS